MDKWMNGKMDGQNRRLEITKDKTQINSKFKKNKITNMRSQGLIN
jgi:hypothetical protein